MLSDDLSGRVGLGRFGTGQLAARIPWDCLQSILVPSWVRTTPRSCKNLRHCSSSVKPNSDSTKETAIEGRYLHQSCQSTGRGTQGQARKKAKQHKLVKQYTHKNRTHYVDYLAIYGNSRPRISLTEFRLSELLISTKFQTLHYQYAGGHSRTL